VLSVAARDGPAPRALAFPGRALRPVGPFSPAARSQLSADHAVVPPRDHLTAQQCATLHTGTGLGERVLIRLLRRPPQIARSTTCASTWAAMAGTLVLNVSSTPDIVWESTATLPVGPGGSIGQPVTDRLVGIGREHPVDERDFPG